ncbi:hypothetical protein HIM_10206 [Hirsutella minnesotensis 3608]|uniref:VOC domain-containing protein n=1 Tax=Hirsutella minnesotensis 3608 TaxID=1043627 RepID=A0A0F7ZXA9_9HYPO|nr:hypothetical protein HIM_10206 [Hirsutella minnesotensis 3608]
MGQIPFVEVSHLASSTSFYSAILQPLGLEYLDSSGSRLHCVSFGLGGDPILQLRQTSEVPELSVMVFAAPSRSAVLDLYGCALRANSSLRLRDVGRQQPLGRHLGITQDGKTARVAVLDLDGNRIEAIYPDPHPTHTMSQVPPALHHFSSAARGAVRIVSWKRDASESSRLPRTPVDPKLSSPPGPAFPRESTDRETSADRESASPPASEQESSQQASASISTSTVVGALLGVAAGAALTYGFISRSSHDADRGEPLGPRDQPCRPMFPEQHKQQHKPQPEDRKSVVSRRIAFAYPERDFISSSRRDYEQEFEPETSNRQPPWYLMQNPRRSSSSHHSDGKSTASGATARAKYPREARGRPSSEDLQARSRSEAAPSRATLPFVEIEERGAAPTTSLHSAPASKPRYPEPGYQSAHVVYEPKRSTYVSAHGHRPASIISRPRSRAPSSATVQPERTHRGRPSSRAARSVVTPTRSVITGGSKAQSILSARHIPLPASVPPSHVSACHVPLPGSRAPSFVSARELPLPFSDVGSSKANWDDDLDSVVPSDSISCVGSGGSSSRQSRKHRHK